MDMTQSSSVKILENLIKQKCFSSPKKICIGMQILNAEIVGREPHQFTFSSKTFEGKFQF